jgi:hypothetical protein
MAGVASLYKSASNGVFIHLEMLERASSKVQVAHQPPSLGRADEYLNLVHLRLQKGAPATSLLLRSDVFLSKRVLDLTVCNVEVVCNVLVCPSNIPQGLDLDALIAAKVL